MGVQPWAPTRSPGSVPRGPPAARPGPCGAGSAAPRALGLFLGKAWMGRGAGDLSHDAGDATGRRGLRFQLSIPGPWLSGGRCHLPAPPQRPRGRGRGQLSHQISPGQGLSRAPRPPPFGPAASKPVFSQEELSISGSPFFAARCRAASAAPIVCCPRPSWFPSSSAGGGQQSPRALGALQVGGGHGCCPAEKPLEKLPRPGARAQLGIAMPGKPEQHGKRQHEG